jgi:hypothetical protein
LTYDIACLLYDYKMPVYNTECDKLLNMYAYLVKKPIKEIKRWTYICALARTMKSAGRHFKIYHLTGRQDSLERAIKASIHITTLCK